ncbi:MAG: hypothetical protein LLG02_03400 [Pelosinus sp.]|nr:hypothetical protein [Pelosinus sp.]
MYAQLYNVALTWLIIIVSFVVYALSVHLRYTKRCISLFVLKWVNMVLIGINIYMICGTSIIGWTPLIFFLFLCYPMFYCLEIDKEMDRFKENNAPEEEIEEFRKRIKKELVPWAILFGVFILVVIILACNKIIL